MVDGIAAITGKDADFFKSFTETPVVAVPFGINPADYSFSVRAVKDPTIFIIGAMNWIPNQEGVRWFLDNVWSDLFRHYPGLRFHIAGREMPAWMKNLQLPNVIVEGEVEDGGYLRLRLWAQVDQNVAARNEVEARKRWVRQHVLHGEHYVGA